MIEGHDAVAVSSIYILAVAHADVPDHQIITSVINADSTQAALLILVNNMQATSGDETIQDKDTDLAL